MLELNLILKVGKREHLDSFVKGNILLKCHHFLENEDKLKIKLQGDILKGETKMFAKKMIMQYLDAKEVIAEYGKVNGLMRVEPAEKCRYIVIW